MKKWLIIGSVIFLLLMGGVYIFIPARLVVVRSALVRCNANGAAKFLDTEDNWAKWWPRNTAVGYRLVGHSSVMIDLLLHHNDSITSTIVILPQNGVDSAAVHWECIINAGLNPFTRIRQYREAEFMGAVMDSSLRILAPFLEKMENVYGFNIRNGGIRDSFLVATRTLLNAYPSTGEVYKMVDALKEYATAGQAKETNYPMLNVTPTAAGQFQVMTAIPVDKILKPKGDIFSRKLVSGQFLITEVRGGPSRVDDALGEMQGYIADYHLAAMAIPFQFLITDRRGEPDSTKWITRLYYPVY